MIFETQFGWAGIGMSRKGICRIVLPRKGAVAVRQELAGDKARSEKAPSAVEMNRAVRLLTKYFSGMPVSFDLALDLGYYTPFQRVVWTAAARIPHGETRSYGWIAREIGKPQAARAVGQAMGANPVPILVP